MNLDILTYSKIVVDVFSCVSTFARLRLHIDFTLKWASSSTHHNLSTQSKSTRQSIKCHTIAPKTAKDSVIDQVNWVIVEMDGKKALDRDSLSLLTFFYFLAQFYRCIVCHPVPFESRTKERPLYLLPRERQLWDISLGHSSGRQHVTYHATMTITAKGGAHEIISKFMTLEKRKVDGVLLCCIVLSTGFDLTFSLSASMLDIHGNTRVLGWLRPEPL